eukprot:GHVP01038307.1.p1 GENE.GHVP01038307.1~~GHVP01038307.1.p1  ORF type:complete len:148 (+),score=33.02 GHVP01038307.1:765-1208(+)
MSIKYIKNDHTEEPFANTEYQNFKDFKKQMVAKITTEKPNDSLSDIFVEARRKKLYFQKEPDFNFHYYEFQKLNESANFPTKIFIHLLTEEAYITFNFADGVHKSEFKKSDDHSLWREIAKWGNSEGGVIVGEEYSDEESSEDELGR